MAKFAKSVSFRCAFCKADCKVVIHKNEGAAIELSHAAPHCDQYERQSSADFVLDMLGETYSTVICTDRAETSLDVADETLAEPLAEEKTDETLAEPLAEEKTDVIVIESDADETETILDLRMQVAELRDENAALRKDYTDLRAEMHRRLGDIERSVRETQPPPPTPADGVPDTKPENPIPPAQG